MITNKGTYQAQINRLERLIEQLTNICEIYDMNLEIHKRKIDELYIMIEKLGRGEEEHNG